MIAVPRTSNWIRAAIGTQKQREVARNMGISEQYLSDIIHGRRLISARAAIEFERVLELDALMLMYMQIQKLLYQARVDRDAEQDTSDWYRKRQDEDMRE